MYIRIAMVGGSLHLYTNWCSYVCSYMSLLHVADVHVQFVVSLSLSSVGVDGLLTLSYASLCVSEPAC